MIWNYGKQIMTVKLIKTEHALLPWEEAICARIGYERQLPYLGKPKANRNYSEGDVWEIWQHSIAAGSELAFARMIGLEDFVPHVNKWKTQEDVPGFEIRYSFKKTGIRLSSWDDENATYILIGDGLNVKTRRNEYNNWASEPYRALGWATGKQIKEQGVFDLKYNYWMLPLDNTNKMEQL
jgi:hypothetical protein